LHVDPDGEETLVLAGTFSDEHGRYPAGTYMLNPDGTSHAPEVDGGCVLFVKLCQYGGSGRLQTTIHAPELEWRSGGLSVKQLYHQDDFAETMELVRFAPGVEGPRSPMARNCSSSAAS